MNININTAKNTAKAVKAGNDVPQPDMQAAFDRLSQPDQIHDIESDDLRSVLWNTNLVTLDDEPKATPQ